MSLQAFKVTPDGRSIDDNARFSGRAVIRMHIQPLAVIATRVTYVYVARSPFNNPIVQTGSLYTQVEARAEIRGSGEATVTIDFTARRPIFVVIETGYLEPYYGEGEFIRIAADSVSVLEAYIEVGGRRYAATRVDVGSQFIDIYFDTLSKTAEDELNETMRRVLEPLRLEVTYLPENLVQAYGWETVRPAFSKYFRVFEAGENWAFVGFEAHQYGYGGNVMDWLFTEPLLYVEVRRDGNIYIKCVDYEFRYCGIKLFYGQHLLIELPFAWSVWDYERCKSMILGREWVIELPKVVAVEITGVSNQNPKPGKWIVIYWRVLLSSELSQGYIIDADYYIDINGQTRQLDISNPNDIAVTSVKGNEIDYRTWLRFDQASTYIVRIGVAYKGIKSW